VLVAPGRPLEFRRLPLPHLGPGETLVRVTACSLCASDLHTFHGRRPHAFPTILGHEIVGTVLAFGTGPRPHDHNGVPLELGERITWAVCGSCGTCDRCAKGLTQKCRFLFKYGHAGLDSSHALSGGLADHVHLLPGTTIVRLPAELSDAGAAPASCAVATAAAMLRNAGGGRGRTVVVLGAGMVGLAAASLARAAGAAWVAILDPDPIRRSRVATVVPGCHALELPADPTALASLLESCGGDDGFDLVFEASGAAEAAARGLDLTATGGTCVFAGTVSPVGTIAVDPERVVRRQLTIRGVHNYIAGDLAVAVGHLAAPAGAPLAAAVGPTYSLDSAAEALEAASTGRHLRIVVSP